MAESDTLGLFHAVSASGSGYPAAICSHELSIQDGSWEKFMGNKSEEVIVDLV